MIVIDPRSPVPPYEQLREQLFGAVSSGELAPGSRLPTVRRLADDLGLAPGTVARAYRELEAAGLVVTRRGGGTRVADRPSSASAAVTSLLEEAAREYLARAKALGAGPDRAIQVVEIVSRRH